MEMASVDTSENSNADKASRRSVSEKVEAIEEGAKALADAVGIPLNDEKIDNSDEMSTASTVDLRKLVNAEVAPPKSLVLIWLLMAAELGFDLITTAIAFFNITVYRGDYLCCDEPVYMGPLPVTASIPFLFLIVAEMTFLVRAILLTLWPSIFETTRVATHEIDDDEKQIDGDQIGFEVTLTRTRSESTADAEETNFSEDDTNGDEHSNDQVDSVTTDIKEDDSEQDEGETRRDTGNNPASGSSTMEIPRENDPEFVDSRKRRTQSSCWKRVFCCFLKWNARMLLSILNLLTLANPIFGCIIAYILLYQSDKTESFVVLGIESLSIILHFVSVRMEGGLRTWWSKLLHSVAILPFLITVIMVLVFLREGGMCYTVENRVLRFTGCEICPDSLEPPIDGMCGNSTLDGIGGFEEEWSNVRDSFNSFSDLKNIASVIERGAEQGDYCSETQNFCFFEF